MRRRKECDDDWRDDSDLRGNGEALQTSVSEGFNVNAERGRQGKRKKVKKKMHKKSKRNSKK